MADDLERLAACAGLRPDFLDSWGHRRALSAETKHALLRAMGYPVESPADLAAALREVEAAPWRRLLPPVCVVRRTRERGPVVPITVPSSRALGPLAWQFEHELGEVVQGTVRVADLPIDETRMVDGVAMERRLFTLPFSPKYGYHHLRVSDGGAEGQEPARAPFVVAPASCYQPALWRRDGRTWGISLQVYGLRSARNWGIGDFSDLSEALEAAARLGAGALGVNPLHALFPGQPLHASPYSPSDRRFLNPLYLDVEAIPDFAESQGAQELVASPEVRRILAEVRSAELVEYAKVGALKRRAFEMIYQSFRARHLGAEGGAESERGAAFRRFQHLGGRDLESLGRFEALCEHFADQPSWRDWPAPYRDPGSEEVARFAETRRERVEFFQYLQWQADLQLRAMADRRRSLGMPIGLYHDLAVGVDGNGAEAWARRDLYALGASIGAPPDPWNRRGQDWGMPPIIPGVLRDQAYGRFVATLRANMRHGGALRIDHAMGLDRLYWIPRGAAPTEGGYVSYPLDDLMAILALESRRQKCVVIGEDLGTVPTGFRARMRKAGILSYRLLYFEQDSRGEFTRPAKYPRLAAATVGTHDLATLPGFWAGRDLKVRTELGLYPSREAEDEAREQRASERRQLVAALKREGLLPQSVDEDKADLSPEMVLAIYRYLAKTRARLLMVHLEDLLGQVDQINLPGTTEEHPNWRRKLGLDVRMVERDPRVLDLAAMLRQVRPPAAPRARPR